VSVRDAPRTSRERDAVLRFKREVCERRDDVDPDEEQDWFSLSLGFFLALGIDADRAYSLSTWVRYDQQYFAN